MRCIQNLRLVLPNVLQKRERTDDFFRSFNQKLGQLNSAAHSFARTIHDNALERALQVIHAIIKAVCQCIDVFTVNWGDKGQVKLVDNRIIDSIGFVFQIHDFLDLVRGLAVIQHNLVHHQRSFIEIIGAVYEQVKELAVLFFEFKHIVLRPPERNITYTQFNYNIICPSVQPQIFSNS